MKTLYSYIILLLVGCAACKTDALSPKEELPAATQKGLNTFGCLVNGEVWVPRGSINPSISKFTFYYDDELLNIAATRTIGSKDIRQTMFLRVKDMADKGNYMLSNFEPGGGGYSDINLSCYYETNSTQTGTLTITKLDTTNHIIAGTFAFTVWTEECDTIRVTDGRFDIQYHQ